MNEADDARAPRFRRFLGLRIRIFLLILLLVGPLFLLAKAGSDREHDQARDDVERALAAVAHGVARSEGDLVGRNHLILDALVRVPEALGGHETCRTLLQSVLDAEAGYTNVALFERDGAARCSALPLPEGYRASGNPSFARALANGDFAVGSYRIDASGPQLSVAHAAVDARGEVNAVAVAWVNLDWISDAEAIGELPEGSVVAVVADDGTILARLPDPYGHVGGRIETPLLETVRDGTGIARERDVDGVERLLAHRPLAAPSGGYVYVGTSVDVAYSVADAAYRDELLWLGAIALLMLVTALVLSEVFVLAPIRRLRGTVRRLGSGDLSARTRVATRGEVGELARAFDEMTVALAAREEEAAVATREVEHALAELERSQRALKRMLGAVVTAQEEERRRIAGEVHDDAVQAMTAHLLGLQLLRRRLADTEHATQMMALEQTAAEAIDRLRRLLFDLHTPVLDHQGLAAACEALLARTFAGKGTTWHVDDWLQEEPPEIVRTVAYRITQEAIVNVYRHAHATHLEVRLASEDGTLFVSVSDDGRGFANDDMPTPGHFGIETMRQRAALAGGELTIVSEPGRGTDVRCRLPVETETPAAWIRG